MKVWSHWLIAAVGVFFGSVGSASAKDLYLITNNDMYSAHVSKECLYEGKRQKWSANNEPDALVTLKSFVLRSGDFEFDPTKGLASRARRTFDHIVKQIGCDPNRVVIRAANEVYSSQDFGLGKVNPSALLRFLNSAQLIDGTPEIDARSIAAMVLEDLTAPDLDRLPNSQQIALGQALYCDTDLANPGRDEFARRAYRARLRQLFASPQSTITFPSRRPIARKFIKRTKVVLGRYNFDTQSFSIQIPYDLGQVIIWGCVDDPESQRLVIDQGPLFDGSPRAFRRRLREKTAVTLRVPETIAQRIVSKHERRIIVEIDYTPRFEVSNEKKLTYSVEYGTVAFRTVDGSVLHTMNLGDIVNTLRKDAQAAQQADAATRRNEQAERERAARDRQQAEQERTTFVQWYATLGNENFATLRLDPPGQVSFPEIKPLTDISALEGDWLGVPSHLSTGGLRLSVRNGKFVLIAYASGRRPSHLAGAVKETQNGFMLAEDAILSREINKAMSDSKLSPFFLRRTDDMEITVGYLDEKLVIQSNTNRNVFGQPFFTVMSSANSVRAETAANATLSKERLEDEFENLPPLAFAAARGPAPADAGPKEELGQLLIDLAKGTIEVQVHNGSEIRTRRNFAVPGTPQQPAACLNCTALERDIANLRSGDELPAEQADPGLKFVTELRDVNGTWISLDGTIQLDTKDGVFRLAKRLETGLTKYLLGQLKPWKENGGYTVELSEYVPTSFTFGYAPKERSDQPQGHDRTRIPDIALVMIDSDLALYAYGSAGFATSVLPYRNGNNAIVVFQRPATR